MLMLSILKSKDWQIVLKKEDPTNCCLQGMQLTAKEKQA
jgi:hypothetical protein